MPDAPSYSAVRAKLRVLEEKGHVRHQEEALRYVYLPVVARDMARKSALRHMVSTFFAGSVEETVAALLDLSAANLASKDLERISRMIETGRKQGEPCPSEARKNAPASGRRQAESTPHQCKPMTCPQRHGQSARSMRAGRVMIAQTSPRAPSTAIPSSRKGSRSSQTSG
jgi:BlaI family penicillinase repressor